MNIESAFRRIEGRLVTPQTKHNCSFEQLLLWSTHILLHDRARLKDDNDIYAGDLPLIRQTAKDVFDHLMQNWRQSANEIRDAHEHLQHAIDDLAQDLVFRPVL